MSLVTIVDEANWLSDNYLYKSEQVKEAIPASFYTRGTDTLIVVEKTDTSLRINKRGISNFSTDSMGIINTCESLYYKENGLYIVDYFTKKIIAYKTNKRIEIDKEGWSILPPNRSISSVIMLGNDGVMYRTSSSTANIIFLLRLFSMSLGFKNEDDLSGLTFLLDTFSRRYNLAPIDRESFPLKETIFPEVVEEIIGRSKVSEIKLKETQFESLIKMTDIEENKKEIIILPETITNLSAEPKLYLSEILDYGLCNYSEEYIILEVDAFNMYIDSAYILAGQLYVEAKDETSYNKLVELLGDNCVLMINTDGKLQ